MSNELNKHRWGNQETEIKPKSSSEIKKKSGFSPGPWIALVCGAWFWFIAMWVPASFSPSYAIQTFIGMAATAIGLVLIGLLIYLSKRS